ncbi:hypothetical protein BDZ85DRAFT_34161 [Elsinoe ampelina]|uniref:Uncharacterized protein n=1 Tax=Elsinoe ampelina TaxID=302913 RepID=A0A6A6G437_9PEZI|nr:hypothetical protein BDZ85DRAFT_34161 [Elsinoe ampelina]
MDAPWDVSGASGFALGAHFWLKPDSPRPSKSFLSGVDTCCSDSGLRAPLTGSISTSACQKDDFDTSTPGLLDSRLFDLRLLDFGRPSLGLPSLGLPSLGLPSLGLPSLGLPSLGLPSLGLPSLGLPTLGSRLRTTNARFSTFDFPTGIDRWRRSLGLDEGFGWVDGWYLMGLRVCWVLRGD